MSKAEQFRASYAPTRRANYRQVIDHLHETDPDLLHAVEEALANESLSLAAVHRSIREVGVDIGYSSLIRWRDHVRG